MSLMDGLGRKKRIRAAHRSSATRDVNGAYELIRSSEVNLAKLRQAKQTLTEKLKTLADCDAQILELTAEDDLEGEIESADLTREKITLCIIDIDAVIDLATKGGTITPLLTEPVVHTGPSVPVDDGATTGHEHSTTGTPGDGHETPSDAHTAESLPPRSTTPHTLTAPAERSAAMAARGVKLPQSRNLAVT